MLAQKKLATNYTHCTNLFLLLVAVVAAFVVASCSSAPTDVRTVVPGDALVYLETQDLGKALQAVTDNDAFRAAAKSQPDFSALNGIKVGVAVTGFETKEEKVSDENSVLNFQPRFVAVAETNAWNYQAIKFAENKLGEFVNDIYGGGVELERFPRYDGDYFVWTANDGRKAYGLVIGSLIFFGNDETALEKCVAVRKGEAESIAKNSKLPSGELLASGYISPDGVAQVSNIATIQLAVGAGEEGEVRGFIARVLPEILRKSITEVAWTARKTEQGIEDKLIIGLNSDLTSIFRETIVPGSGPDAMGLSYVPRVARSFTAYNLRDPQIALRSVLLSAQSGTEEPGRGLIPEIAPILFEPYGIEDPEAFLSSVGSSIITIRIDDEKVGVIASVQAEDAAKKALGKAFKVTETEANGTTWLRDADDENIAAITSGLVIVGDAETVRAALGALREKPNIPQPIYDKIMQSKAVAITFGSEDDVAQTLAKVLAIPTETVAISSTYLTESFIVGIGVERRTISNFGLIGSIIEQFGKEH